jgi:hypothetical protein
MQLDFLADLSMLARTTPLKKINKTLYAKTTNTLMTQKARPMIAMGHLNIGKCEAQICL